MDFNRRNLLCGLGGLAVGGMVCGMSCSSYAAEAEKAPGGGRFAQVNGEFGWKPHKLDPAESQQIAYDGYWYKGYACATMAAHFLWGICLFIDRIYVLSYFDEITLWKNITMLSDYITPTTQILIDFILFKP